MSQDKTDLDKCEHPSIVYDNEKILCGVCGKEPLRVVKPRDITRIVVGHTRSISWDRNIWSFPISLDAKIQVDSWREVRQAYLELFNEARKEINNAVRSIRPELADPTKRPEYFL